MDRVPRSIAERRVFIDTSAFLALIDGDDRYHEQASVALRRLERGRYRLVTTKYVIVETQAAILSAVGPAVARAFLRSALRSATDVLPTEPSDEERAEQILFSYIDKRYSLCDAISFAVMERLHIRLAFAFDEHFRQHGFVTPLSRDSWP